MWGITYVNPTWREELREFHPNGNMGRVLGMGQALIALEGYEIIAHARDEIKRPKKNIPRAIFISLGIVVSVYVVFAFVFIGGLDPSQVGLPAWEFLGGFVSLVIIAAAEEYLRFGALSVLAGGFV